ncbi:MAG: winged helix-turn-helix domain-containing protein [Vicinamibacteria bacterium]
MPRVRLEDFTLDLETGELVRGDARVKLQHQPFRVLAALVERPGQLVTRDELRARIWGSDTHVDFEQGLNFCVRQVRAALGDDALSPRFVETLPRRGYRLVAAVQRLDAPEARRRAPALLLAAALGALLVLVSSLLLPARASQREPRPAAPSMILVLPFESLGGAEPDYLSDGLTEEMINGLGRVAPKHLGVIARTSAMAYKGSRKTIARIGSELGVDYVLEGALRRSGQRVRVTARLVRVRGQAQLWAGSFDADGEDLLALQNDLATRIAAALSVRLAPDPGRRAAPAAQEALLKGRYHLARAGAAGVAEALRFFAEAAELDPRSALAQAGLAEAWIASANRDGLAPQEGYEKARAAVRRALELDPGSAIALRLEAQIALYHDWNFAAAGAAFERSLAKAPALAETHYWHASYLSVTGRLEGAREAIRRAEELDPLSTAVRGDAAWYALCARRFEEAEARARLALDLEPADAMAREILIAARIAGGRWDAALEELRAAARASGALPPELTGLRGEAGLHEHLRWRLRELERRDPDGRWLGLRAVASIQAGQPAQALRWLERAYERRWPWLVATLPVDPRLDPLRGEPAFQALLARLGLPPDLEPAALRARAPGPDVPPRPDAGD